MAKVLENNAFPMKKLANFLDNYQSTNKHIVQ